MKNLLVPMMIGLLIAACSPTRRDLKASKHIENQSAYTSIENTGPSKTIYYASTKRIITIENSEDSLQKRMDQAKIEMLRKIEKDKAESLANLRKSMTTKIYTTTLAVDVKKSSVTVEEDTVYTVKGSGGWYAVE